MKFKNKLIIFQLKVNIKFNLAYDDIYYGNRYTKIKLEKEIFINYYKDRRTYIKLSYIFI